MQGHVECCHDEEQKLRKHDEDVPRHDEHVDDGHEHDGVVHEDVERSDDGGSALRVHDGDASHEYDDPLTGGGRFHEERSVPCAAGVRVKTFGANCGEISGVSASSWG